MKTYAKTDSNGIIENWQQMPEAQDMPEGQQLAEPPTGWVEVPALQVPALAVGAKLVAGTVQAKPVDPRMWWIGVGVFFDRFLTAKMAVLTSTNAVAKALILDAQVRPYIDLKSTALAQGLATLQAQNIAGLTPAIIASITTTPTTEAERHIKGLA